MLVVTPGEWSEGGSYFTPITCVLFDYITITCTNGVFLVLLFKLKKGI